MDKLHVVGYLRSSDYHMAVHIVQMLIEKHPKLFCEYSPSEGLMEFQWNLKKGEIKQAVSNNAERLIAEEMVNVAIFVNDTLSWTSVAGLIRWARETLLLGLQDTLSQMNFQDISQTAYEEFFSNSTSVFVYMRICVDKGRDLGQLTLQLFNDLCPKTVENFVCLCNGEKSISSEGQSTQLSYLNSIIHRIVPNGWIQGGDISNRGAGSSGISIYGKTFPDESYAVSHDTPGILGMANHGRNTNASQFYITLKPSQWMDGQYVAFGRVIEGSGVLKEIESLDTYNERPVMPCYVSECGVLSLP